MLRFSVMRGKNHSVLIRVQHGDRLLDFWTLGEMPQFQAEAVRRMIDQEVSDHIEAIRREAYERGWSDAKKKRRKLTRFYRCINAVAASVGY